MLLGIKSKKELFLRHLLVGGISAIFVYLFYLWRSELPVKVGLWRAFGDTGFILLAVVLAIGPLAKLWLSFSVLVPWRREVGIWFAVLSFSHFYLINGFNLSKNLLNMPMLLGVVALIFTLILAFTSSDWAVNFLGISAWKWLQSSVYTVFYLVFFHIFYFISKRPEVDWFYYSFIGLTLSVIILQIGAFIKTVMEQRSKDWY